METKEIEKASLILWVVLFTSGVLFRILLAIAVSYFYIVYLEYPKNLSVIIFIVCLLSITEYINNKCWKFW